MTLFCRRAPAAARPAVCVSKTAAGWARKAVPDVVPRAQPAGQARGLTASDLSYLQRCHLVPLPRPAPGSWPRRHRAEVPGPERRATRRRPTCGRTRARHCDIAQLGGAAADYSTCELFWTGTRRRPRRRAAALPRGCHVITSAAPPVGRRPSAAPIRSWPGRPARFRLTYEAQYVYCVSCVNLRENNNG